MPEEDHIRATCGYLISGKDCPHVAAGLRGEHKFGRPVECAFGHDHEVERLMVRDSLESHKQYCWGMKEKYAKDNGIVLPPSVKPPKKPVNRHWS